MTPDPQIDWLMAANEAFGVAMDGFPKDAVKVVALLALRDIIASEVRLGASLDDQCEGVRTYLNNSIVRELAGDLTPLEAIFSGAADADPDGDA